MYLAQHECGHQTRWAKKSHCPRLGDRIWCVRCERNTQVVGIVGPWRTKCLSCRLLDREATQERTVLKHAYVHANYRPKHRIQVWQFGVRGSVRTFTGAEVGTQMVLDSPPPF